MGRVGSDAFKSMGNKKDQGITPCKERASVTPARTVLSSPSQEA
jgi:hypothetical protein